MFGLVGIFDYVMDIVIHVILLQKNYNVDIFVPRQYLATRYSEINNHAQCYACNMLFGGQPSKYALNLQRDYGNDIVQKLEDTRKVIIRDMDYKAIGDEYKEKYETLLNQEDVL